MSVRKNPPSVVIEDEILIPAELMVTPDPPPKRPNKVAIGAKLKAGEDVPGARLMQTEILRSANRDARIRSLQRRGRLFPRPRALGDAHCGVLRDRSVLQNRASETLAERAML